VCGGFWVAMNNDPSLMVATLLRENILPIGAPRLEIENISALLSHSLKPSLVGPKDASACAFLLCSSDDCHIVSG